MEFRILGPLEVVDDGGRTVAVGGSPERALLALLLLAANRVVSTERLVDELWGEGPPEGAIHAVRVYVSRLRKTLREAGEDGVLVTRTPGYMVRVRPEALDANRFETLLVVGREQVVGGDHVGASQTLGEALALWRGPALADVVDAPLARTEATRLEESRLAALEERIEADLACGRHREVVAELDALSRAHPLRERLWAQRMLALYRAGRQAEALRAYQELRRILGEELGLEPSGALRRLEKAILRQASEIEWWPSGLVSEPEPDGAPLPLPPELAVGCSRPFVSRVAELEMAERVLADIRRERLAVLWLLGEPGIGKTRLATEIARRAHSAGSVVLFGRCNEDLAIPYQPFLEALRWHVLHLPDIELTYRLGDSPGELTRLVPEIGDRVPGLEATRSTSPEIEQHRFFEAVRLWLAAAGGGQPLVAVLDDVHWAARPTLTLLGHVARSAEPSGTLLVCTARTTSPDANEALADLVEELDRRGVPSHRLEVGGLSVDGVGELVESAAGRCLDDGLLALATELQGETAGNPLFVEAVLASLPFDAPNPAWHPGDLPRTLAETVLRRVTRLPADVVELLRTAAVIGLDFDLRVAARAAGRDELATLEALESAAQAGLVEETGANRHRFSHALVRSALREQLSRSRRVRVHLQVGEALEAVYGGHLDEHADALAYHFGEAQSVGGAPEAFRYTMLAAERATHLLSHHEAAAAYERALELLELVDVEGPLGRYELLFALGKARRRSGDLIGALAALRAAAEEATAREAPEPLARAAVAAEETSFWVGLPGQDALAPLERAEVALPTEDSTLRAVVVASLSRALQFSGRRNEGIERGDEALAMAERLGDAATTLAVLARANLPYLMSIAEAPVVAARWLDVISRAGKLRDDDAYIHGMGMALWATAQVGDLTTFNDLFAAYSRLTSELRQPTWEHFHDLFRSFRAFLAGDLETAERALQQAEELGESLGWAREGLYGVGMFLIRREQGRLADLVPAVRALVRLNPGAAVWRPGLAALYAELQMLDEARSEFAGFASTGFANLPVDGTRELCLGLLAEVCATLGDTERAGELIECLLPCAGRLLILFGSAACLGPIDRILGMLASTAGRGDDAERWHKRGLDLARRLDSPLWNAHCLYDSAAHLLRSDGARAQRMLTEAAVLCRRHGLAGLAPRVAHLRATG